MSVSPLVGVALLAAVLSGASAFVSIGGNDATHVTITREALLQKLTEVCRTIAVSEDREFNPTGSSGEELIQACLGPTATGEVSAAKFHEALNDIYVQNGRVDRDFVNSPPHHFNSEAFAQGRGLITEGVASIKANIRNENFQAAREALGRVLHTLQDFYSHSNWVELGNTQPYVNLIRPDLPLENLTDVVTPTCSGCAVTGPNSILSTILAQKKLTSGYMGIVSPAKPQGKCSHGGVDDLSSSVAPHGGINKDDRRPENVALYTAAVTMATNATLQLLEDIRVTAGDDEYLRLMGIVRSSVVCFVIDTTGSMRDDIAEAKRVVYEIIDSKKGTQDEPSQYILVPFNDPEFGPLTRTRDPNVMKTEISKLAAFGGGDAPEMCLSGLQLALTGAPASSDIYVFTDASAKDIALKDTIIALMRSTKSTVSFFMTDVLRRRRSVEAVTGFQTYRDLALASGGQAIRVSKANLRQATDIILDTSTSALVTVLQRVRSPGQDETFSFLLDESLKNVTLYITGTELLFTLRNPSGVLQSHNEVSGKLGTIQTVGNLHRVRLNSDKQNGMWQISIDSTQPYTLKVTGQSTITFIYDFVEAFKGPHPGYVPIAGRPQAGTPVTLLLSVMGRKGPQSVKVGEVALVTVSGSEVISGIVGDMGNGDILVTIIEVPAGEFVVLLKGSDVVSSSEFQRQSTTQMSVSKVVIKAVVDRSMEPGKAFTLPFTVETKTTRGACVITVKNDKDFAMAYPASLPLMTDGSANGTVTLTAPANTPSGTDVTLTIEAKSPGATDFNYAVLRLSVVSKITDFTRPQCQVVSVTADCPADCSLASWELSANLTDGTGTGIEAIDLHVGSGTLTLTPLSSPVVQATYNASCCSETVELVARDRVGNVGNCYYSITRSAGPAPLTLSLPLWACLLVSVLTRP